MASRRYPIGAELLTPDHASFRVWAPEAAGLTVEVDGVPTPMHREADGYFTAELPARSGARYGFRFPDDPRLYPDPASRWQPEGPEEPSALADSSSFEWHDAAWEGVALPGQVLYEIHVGTFTADGTWRAAEARLPQLRELGVTVIQMMPVAEFAGDFGWGYDGVQWFAPMHTYGSPGGPAALRRHRSSARTRSHPRRRLQPPRSVGQLPAAVLAPLLHRAPQERMGDGAELR